ncbi:X-box-binding protein 1 [Neodiprion virginianus]|uniref:X-box-binding protein 1 n=1 Tax=Neodiprion virginianus TaxID=2961670 RepID=UPI00076FA5C0|nr:X-box-binding protein 1 [Neodiprion virginianus]
MSVLKSIIITVPKGLSKTPGFSTQKLNFTTSLLTENNANKINNRKMSTTEDDAALDGSIIEQEICFRGKKRRLDHLTWEEKIQRKKLKNRVAAQTSRDRKRAKLDELEETVRVLRDRNETLAQECSALKSQNEVLTVENTSLRRDLESRTTTGEQHCSKCQSSVSCVAPMQGSAVSPKYPLPQGGATELAPVLTLTQPAATLWRILTLYLLSKNCLQTSKETITSRDLKNWPKAFCERLPPKWKQMLINQVNKSTSQGMPPKNLAIQQEWWGRHQKMWKPIELVEA